MRSQSMQRKTRERERERERKRVITVFRLFVLITPKRGGREEGNCAPIHGYECELFAKQNLRNNLLSRKRNFVRTDPLQRIKLHLQNENRSAAKSD